MQIIRTNGAHSSREEEGEERGNFHAAPKRIALRSPRPASPHGRWQRGGRRRAPGEGGPAAPGAAPGPAPAPRPAPPAREAPPRALPARPGPSARRPGPARPPAARAGPGGWAEACAVPAKPRRSSRQSGSAPPPLLLASPSFLPRPGLRLALTRLPRPCPARGACARLSLRGAARRRRRPGRRGRAVGERAGKEERGEGGGGEGWGGKAREGEEKRGEETAAALPRRDLWRRAGRALGRLLRRPLGERRGISELGALRCQPGHHLTLGRLALDAASPALAPPTVGGEQRRGAAAGTESDGDGAGRDGSCRRLSRAARGRFAAAAGERRRPPRAATASRPPRSSVRTSAPGRSAATGDGYPGSVARSKQKAATRELACAWFALSSCKIQGNCVFVCSGRE